MTKTKEMTMKQKGLFDHISAITKGKDPNYWDKLTDGDKKTFSTFMVNRFLSMNEDWVEIVSELDPYTTGIQLKPELVFKLYFELIPKGNIFLKYVKGEGESKFDQSLIDLVANYYEVSKKEAFGYIAILHEIGAEEEIGKFLEQFGYSDKEIKKMCKVL